MSKRGTLAKALIGVTLAFLVFVGVVGIVVDDDAILQVLQVVGPLGILGVLVVGHFVLEE